MMRCTGALVAPSTFHYGVADSLFLFQTVAHLLTGDSLIRQ